MLVNTEATIEAKGNSDGNYSWTSGDGVTITGGANASTVTIKGTKAIKTDGRTLNLPGKIARQVKR